MNEMAIDLAELFEKRKSSKSKSDIDACLFERHALVWYDGEIDPSEERYKTFKKKVYRVIKKLSNDDEYLQKWPLAIGDIDECHLESENPTMLHGLDMQDIVRHFLNGGTQYGIAKNIQKQINSPEFAHRMNKAIRNSQIDVFERAHKRFGNALKKDTDENND